MSTIPLTARQKYDYYDVAPAELKLIRVGHSLWAILRKERRKSHLPGDLAYLEDAIQTIVGLKRELRAELKIARAIRNAEVARRLRPRMA